jgi:MFS family permease
MSVQIHPSTAAPAAPRPGYAAVLRVPGALSAFVPAFVVRLAFAMVMLSVLLMVERQTGSYTLAGATTGALGVTNVLGSPVRARLVDAFGQRRVLPPLAVLYGAGLVGLVAATHAARPSTVLVVVIAALTGACPPPVGAAMRAIWGTVTPPGGLRLRAFSLDSVAEDLAFTAGPLLVSAFLVLADPATAVATAALVIALATWVFTRSPLARAQRPPTNDDVGAATEAGAGPLRQRGFVAMLVVLAGLGLVLGATELATAAFADEHGGDPLAGILLAAFAAGSCLGGLLYGARDWRSGASARLVGLATLVVVLVGSLAVTSLPVAFGMVISLVGFFLGPALVSGYLLADHASTPRTRTQSAAWASTAVNAGASLSTLMLGAVVDAAGTAAALSAGAAVAAVCTAGAALPLLRPHRVRRARRHG